MVKTIEFEGHSVDVDTSAGWLYTYRKQFGNDVLQDIFPIILGVLETLAESGAETEEIRVDTIAEMFLKMAGFELTTLFNIFWAMAANANPKIKPPISFFNQFENIPVDILAPEIFSMVIESSVSSKNSASLLESLKTRTQQSVWNS